MRNLKRSLGRFIAVFAIAMLGAPGASANVILTSANADCSALVATPSQPAVEAAFQTACGTGTVTQLYKADFARAAFGVDTGPYASSYTTTFGGFEEALDDPTTALIQHLVGQPAISGFESLFLMAKDGKSNPSYYGWDITGWNGTEAISLTAWNGIKGAISNVSIWGTQTVPVPEPGTLGLLGLGLLGLGLMRKKANR